MLSQRKSDKHEFSIEEGQWVAQEPKSWDPSDLLAVLVGLESIKWAWILLEVGNEQDVTEYIEWFNRMCKDRKDVSIRSRPCGWQQDGECAQT